MLNSEQTQYIESLSVGYPNLNDGALKETLAQAGWSADEITEALSRYHSTLATPTPPPRTNTAAPQGTTTPSATSTAPTPATATASPLPASAVMPTTTHSEEKPHGHLSHTLFIALAIVLLCGAIGAGAYYVIKHTSIFGGMTFTDETLLPHLVTKLGEIKTAEYSFSVSFDVDTRDANAKPFGADEETSPEELAKYQRDYDRIRDISNIKNELDELQYGGSDSYLDTEDDYAFLEPYPLNLSKLTSKTTDPLGIPYIYTPSADRSSYTLSVTFETTAAAAAIRGGMYGTETLSNENTVTLTESDYISTYSFDGKPAQPKLFGLFDIGDVEEMIPADLAVMFNIGGTVDNSHESPTDAAFRIGGSAAFGDASFAFDAEGIKKGDRYFGIIHKMPSFFSTMSNLREKWYMLTEADLRNYGYGAYIDEIVPSSENEQQKKIADIRAQFSILLDLAVKHGVVTISNTPTKEKVGEVTLTKYQLSLVQEKLLPFYEEATAALEKYDDSILPRDEAVLTYLRSEDFGKIFAYFKEHATYSMWLDRAGFPARTELALRYVPTENATALKDKQLNLVFLSTLRGINEPITVKEPEGALGFDSLISEITGMTKEEILLEQQEMNVETVRDALSSYYSWSGSYPNSLSELTRTRKEVPQSTATDYSGYDNTDYMPSFYGYDEDTPFLKTVPLDVYTKNSYRYAVMGGTYELRYEIQLPPYTKTSNPALYFVYDYSYDATTYGNDAGYFDDSYTRFPEEQITLYLLRFTNGENVATPEYLSTAQQDRKDTDFDGLVDPVETLLGTNATKSDSDDDGFSDAEEITTGSNPTGPGRLEFKERAGIFF